MSIFMSREVITITGLNKKALFSFTFFIDKSSKILYVNYYSICDALSHLAALSKCHIADFKYGKIPRVICVVLELSRVAEGHE